MEPRFGHNFSDVRVHTDAKAAESARAVNSLAYTVGRDIVFGAGQYQPGSSEGRRVLGHELTHTIQQRNRPLGFVQRIPADLPLVAYQMFVLRGKLHDLADKKETKYLPYRNEITNASEIEKSVALSSQQLLTKLQNTLDYMSFTRLVEALGRKAPSFDELRKNSSVLTKLTEAWNASDVGINDGVRQAHEEGGWIFMDLMDGSLHFERATPQYTDAIKLEPAPQVPGGILVACFHTHPNPGNPKPSKDDLREDKRRGVPNLVVAIKGKDLTKYEIYLSGPAVRPHLANDKTFPGPSGGIAP
jgi:proteasome lid subunit RPN8/RPN11